MLNSRFRWPRGLRRGYVTHSFGRGYGFEFCGGHGYLSLVNVVCCRVLVSAKGRSFIQRNFAEYVVCVCVCVSLSGNRCNNILLQLRRVGKIGHNKKERKKERSVIA